MANFTPPAVFFESDVITRSVWVVVDPRDAVTGGRVPVPLEVRLKDVAAEPIAAYSGIYCFTDLKLAAGNYTVQVSSAKSDPGRYFDVERQFTLATIPPATDPLKRNLVEVTLLPRTSYPFDGQTTLVRSRLVKTSDRSPIANAQISLTLDSVDKGLWQQTDERGEFVIFFPRAAPEDNSSAGLKDFKFKLHFDIPGHSFTTIEQTVKEGTTKSLEALEFPGT